MIENRALILLDESDRAGNAPGSSPQMMSFELDMLGEPLSFRIQIARKHARLSDVAPLARTLSDRLCLAIVNKLGAGGRDVPCRKGCSACCRYLVPLSVPEAFRLREDISLLPVEQGKAILQACLDTAKEILAKSPDELTSHEESSQNAICHSERSEESPASTAQTPRLAQGDSLEAVAKSQGTNDPRQTRRIGRWYAGLDLPCPYLSENVCISYERRPIACREHLVTDSAAQCGCESTDEPSVVPMPVSVLECLGQLAAELEQSDVEAVMLPLALPWALKNHDRSQRTWPTTEMVQRFVEILKAAAKKTQTRDQVCG
ncbi:MAG: hypothetical protein JSW66_08885 [Phycisphaerales bacterium]|nr:MAG: hypothetical protein JSW66_08885 [Phycisphaerales bacterium]